VRRIVESTWSEKTTVVQARVLGPLPRADLLPYVHQRYDDLTVLGTSD